MKTLLLTSLVATAVSSGFAQGAIDVGNNFGATVFRAPIYGPQVADPTQSIFGQPGAPAFPTGTTTYTGSRLSGTGFTFGFYASTTGITTDANALSLIGTLGFRTGGAAGFVTTTTMNIPGVQAGSQTTWQIRVWDNQGGTVGYADSLDRGQTPLINSGPLGGITASGPVLNPATSSGWTSFNIYYIPEPGVTLLAGLGSVILLLIRRR
jgi:hypothetical protein